MSSQAYFDQVAPQWDQMRRSFFSSAVREKAYAVADLQPARIAAGTYRNITGNTALALGLVAAAHQSGLPLLLGSYPITPASDILHELAGFKNFGVYTFQAEDEIAGVGSALGAAFGGHVLLL